MVETTKLAIDVATFLIALIGFTTIKRYSKQIETATFSYWSQLKIRLIRIYSIFSKDRTIINNFYPSNFTINWEERPPSDSRLDEFFELANEFYEFLKETQDQMPAYLGWSEDMCTIQGFLSDALTYDIRESQKKYIKEKAVDKKDRDEYYENVCDAMYNMIQGIDEEQKHIEKKLCSGNKYKRKEIHKSRVDQN